jgi:hypothetical protein
VEKLRDDKPAASSKAASRAERLAAELRANLKRRKAATRQAEAGKNAEDYGKPPKGAKPER